MVANPARRAAVTDAALELLGREGARAVTHRAVETEAGMPPGTCANYYPTRAALLAAMAERVFVLLAPDPDRLDRLADLPAAQAAPAYAGYVVERLLDQPSLARALIELRLEAARNPEVAEPLIRFLRTGFAQDVTFHQDRGLPGGKQSVLLLHHVVNGIVLDALTVPLDPDSAPLDQAQAAARAVTMSMGDADI